MLSVGVDRQAVRDHADAAFPDASRCPDPGCVWRCLLTLIFTGDLVRVDTHCSRLAEQPRWSGTGPAAQVLQVIRSRISFLVGDLAETRRILGKMVQSPIAESMEAIVVAWLTEALVQLGDASAAEYLLIGRGFSGALPNDLPGRALLLYAAGGVNMALRRMNRAVNDFLACGREVAACNFANPCVIPWRTGAAMSMLGAEQTDLARALVRTELDAAWKWGSPREIGRASLASAMVHGGSTDLIVEAADLLAIANARSDMTGVARAIGGDQGALRDLPRARQLLRRVADLTERGGNQYAANVASGELARFLATHGNPVLTKREIDVAKLVWAGYNNAEIADRLSLTRRTVEYHLSAVYRKCHLADRRHLYLAMTKFC